MSSAVSKLNGHKVTKELLVQPQLNSIAFRYLVRHDASLTNSKIQIDGTKSILREDMKTLSPFSSSLSLSVLISLSLSFILPIGKLLKVEVSTSSFPAIVKYDLVSRLEWEYDLIVNKADHDFDVLSPLHSLLSLYPFLSCPFQLIINIYV